MGLPLFSSFDIYPSKKCLLNLQTRQRKASGNLGMLSFMFHWGGKLKHGFYFLPVAASSSVNVLWKLFFLEAGETGTVAKALVGFERTRVQTPAPRSVTFWPLCAPVHDNTHSQTHTHTYACTHTCTHTHMYTHIKCFKNKIIPFFNHIDTPHPGNLKMIFLPSVQIVQPHIVSSVVLGEQEGNSLGMKEVTDF